MAGITLKIVHGFSAWGKEYAPGDIIDPAKDLSTWPREVRAETLKTRLENGDIEYTLPTEEVILGEIEETEEIPPAPTTETPAPAGTTGRAFSLPQ